MKKLHGNERLYDLRHRRRKNPNRRSRQELAGRGIAELTTIFKGMKIRYSLPNDQGFFNRYATLVPTLFKLGFIAQLISALTEIGIIYAIIYASLNEFWPKMAPAVAGAGAIIGAGLLEIGLRKFVPYSVRAVLFRRFSGLDLVMSIFILTVAAGLLFASGSLSFKGAKNMVEAIAPDLKERTTAAADSLYQAAQTSTHREWRRDSAAITDRYTRQIKSRRAAWESKVKLGWRDYYKYKSLEKSTGQSYASRKQSVRAKIAQTEADRDVDLAALEDRQAAELTAALDRSRVAIDDARQKWTAGKTEIAAFNLKQADKAENKVDRYGGGLAWFTILCLCVFVCSIILHEVYHKGAKIEERAEPTPYHFQQSILADFSQAVGNKWQYFARSLIQRLEEKTPPPPLPTAPSALYDFDGLEQQKLKIVYRQDGELPVIHLSPRQLGSQSITSKQTAEFNQDVKLQQKEELAGKEVQDNLANSDRYNDDRYQEQNKTRKCKYCSQSFTYKHWNKQFCNDECRLEYHAQKHGGQKYDPGIYKRKRKRKQ